MSDGVVRRSVLIGAGADEVWAALVDPSRLEEWLADEVDAVDAVEGGELVRDGEVVFRWDDGCERVGVVAEVDEPRRLAFRWAELGGEQTSVEFELAPEGGGTRVTVVERGLTARGVAGRRSAGPGLVGPRLAGLRLAACAVAA
jgi:uncharacterized protein YndB with AHSA1/START domain